MYRRLGSSTDRLRILQTVLTLVRLVSHESLIAGATGRGALLTFYDATFLSLAEATDATLVTYDRGMAAHGQTVGRPTLSPGAT